MGTISSPASTVCSSPRSSVRSMTPLLRGGAGRRDGAEPGQVINIKRGLGGREGIEGLVHISDITNEKRLEHPSEAVKIGDKVKELLQ